jgi:hypothetical protein
VVAFRNNSNQHVWVASMRRDTDGCGEGGGGGRRAGGLCRRARRRRPFGRRTKYAAFYAEAQDGSWWGDTAGPSVYVNDDGFNDCYGIDHSAPWRIVSMSEINVGRPPAAPGDAHGQPEQLKS